MYFAPSTRFVGFCRVRASTSEPSIPTNCATSARPTKPVAPVTATRRIGADRQMASNIGLIVVWIFMACSLGYCLDQQGLTLRPPSPRCCSDDRARARWVRTATLGTHSVYGVRLDQLHNCCLR